METHERLYRSTTEKVIGGVAGGLADYFDIDVVLARVIFVLLALFGGGGVIIYIVMWIIIPAQNKSETVYSNNVDNKDTATDGTTTSDAIVKPVSSKQSNTGLIAGVILILMGMLFLGDRLFPWYNIADLWPLLLVAVGVMMIKPSIFKPTKKQNNEI
jgi:phage shock protein C